MRSVLVGCFLLLLSILSKAQSGDQVFLKGYTLNSEHLEIIQLASISTIPNSTKSISNRNGFFRITVHPNDTLKITAIGYQTAVIPVQQIMSTNSTDTIIVLMTAIAYQLNDLDILPSNHHRDSIARIVAKLLVHDSLLNNYDRIYKRPKGKIYVNPNPLYPGIIYQGPITDLYNKFSKEGKDNISFEAFVKYSLRQMKYDERYNSEIVKRITQVNDFDVDELMQTCKLSREFVLIATDYELFEAIKKCGDIFKAEQQAKKLRLR